MSYDAWREMATVFRCISVVLMEGDPDEIGPLTYQLARVAAEHAREARRQEWLDVTRRSAKLYGDPEEAAHFLAAFFTVMPRETRVPLMQLLDDGAWRMACFPEDQAGESFRGEVLVEAAPVR